MGLPHNIILVGFMGSGKTTVGKELSKLLNFRFWDMDQWIEKRNKSTVFDIFEKKGEAYFRAQEKKALRWFKSKKNYVVSTGGGVWIDDENRNLLLKTGWCVWLKVNPINSFQRIGKHLSKRPLLKQGENSKQVIEKILKERESIYSLAHSSFDSNEIPPSQVALEIKKYLKEGRPFDLFPLQK